MTSFAISDVDALSFLASQGYLPVALADHGAMAEAYSQLFSKASDFFSLPHGSPQKTAFQVVDGPAASEEGYSKIPNEKSILTIKTSSHCPQTLHNQASIAWDFTGTFLSKLLAAIAHSLDLQPEAFFPFVKPCILLPADKRTPTLLRMFRYDRPEGPEPIVKAERHTDLGLLSLVVGHSPGLQVQSPASGHWISIEEDVALPPGLKTRSNGLTATLLTGETLAFLTRGKYRAGTHRVVCAPTGNDPYRFSIVFTLRPAMAPVFTENFESDIVGKFAAEEQADGESSAKLFERMRKKRWNVNVAPEIREKQREEQRKNATAVNGQG